VPAAGGSEITLAPAPMRQAGGMVTPSRTVLLKAKKAPGTYGSVATDDRASGDEAMIADAGVVRYTHLAPEYAVIAN